MYLAEGTEQFSTNKIISASKNPGILLNKVVHYRGNYKRWTKLLWQVYHPCKRKL